MRKNIVCLIGIILLTACETASYKAKQAAITENIKQEKDRYWKQYQPYAEAILAKGIKDRYSALSILGRPHFTNHFSATNPFNSNIISFDYAFDECPVLNGQTVEFLELVFNNKDELITIALKIKESALFQKPYGYNRLEYWR